MEKRVIVDPRCEILGIRHGHLNGNGYNLGKVVEETLSFGTNIEGRTVIPSLEGDLVQVDGDGEPVLTHQNIFYLTRKRYEELKHANIATSLKDVLDKVAGYRQTNPGQRVVLCIELKPITRRETIDHAVAQLAEYGISSDDAFFDSSFGNKLDDVSDANERQGTDYKRSLHVNANVGSLLVPIPFFPAREGYDIVSVPKQLSIGDPGKPVIYGSVGSQEMLEEIAKDENAYGVFLRVREGPGLKGVFKRTMNSVSNTQRFRKVHHQ